MKKVKAFVAISPKIEGSNIYLPGGINTLPIYESYHDAYQDGWTKNELVECTISYNSRRD
jgi:hypothetical protein